MTTLEERQDAAEQAYEDAAEQAVTQDWAGEVATTVAVILTAWMLLSGDDDETPADRITELRSTITRILGALTPNMRAVFRQQIGEGIEIGRRHAEPYVRNERTPERSERTRTPPAGPERKDPANEDRDLDPPAPDPEIVNVVDTIDHRVHAQVQETIAYVEHAPLRKRTDIEAVAAKATTAVNIAKRDVSWATNRAINQGVTDVADHAGTGLIWIAERDACLHCLAYSGQVATPGGTFPRNLTFGDRPLNLPAVPYPPRHPHCRCRVRPYDGPPPSDDISDMNQSSVLAREARRSVLRGWSAYDTQPERLRAADRLIQQGANMPKSVVDRALRNLADGKFSRRQTRITGMGS